VRGFRQQYDGLAIHLSDVQIQVDPDHQKAQAAFVATVNTRSKDGIEGNELFSDRFRLFFRKTGEGWQMVRGEYPRSKFD